VKSGLCPEDCRGENNSALALDKLLVEHGRLRALLDNIPDVVFFKDPNGVFLDCNAAFTDLLGYSRYEVIGNTDRAIADVDKYERLKAQDRQVIEQESPLRIHDTWKNYLGQSIEMDVIKAPVFNDQGELLGILGIGRDITHQRQMEDKLRYLAHHDPLTHLPNRSLLAERVVLAMTESACRNTLMAVCYIDLDGFKPVNDTYGHAEGDRLLIEISIRLQRCLRLGDTVARLGGDEFSILLADLENAAQAKTLLEQALSAIALPFQIHPEATVSVSSSIGYTLYPFDHVDADALLRHADQAMYHAKMAGRNRIHQFDLVQDKRERSHLEICERIAAAVSNDELVLYFQPLVDMRAGIVVGAEALVRWQHPERGLLLPGEFLPLIEDTDVIVQLGYWVLSNALANLDLWQKQGLELQMGVNIAARQFMDPEFVRNLATLLACYPNIKPSQLELEILETAALEDMGHVSILMEECCRLGVHFALDDFGTGYSSLTYLKHLSADTLKIDQSFVRDILDDSEDLAIVEGILGLTHAFKRHAIAEGVETIEHGILLLHLGCDYAQGYGIARPMPAAQLADWVRQFEPDPGWITSTTLRWNLENFALVAAEVEHRHWLDLIEQAAQGKLVLSELQLTQLHETENCRFANWCSGTGNDQFGHLEEFGTMLPLHDDLHVVVGRIATDLNTGDTESAKAKLPALHIAYNSFIDALSTLQVVASMRVMA
jgi:diguanylate cyclase (GGDEF)-like protein/PAS domain S-box-containing protein